MGLHLKTVDEIEKRRKIRRRDPRKTYQMHAHERRELQDIIQRNKIEEIDVKLVKTLGTYFGLAKSTIVKELVQIGFTTDKLAQSKPDTPKPETPKPCRKKLGLCQSEAGAKRAPRKIETVSDVGNPEGGDEVKLRAVRGELNLLRSQLAHRETQLKVAEEALRKREIAAEEAIEEAHALEQEARHARDEALERTGRIREPDPDAEVVGLYTGGQVYQLLAVAKRTMELMYRDRIAKLEGQVRAAQEVGEKAVERVERAEPVKQVESAARDTGRRAVGSVDWDTGTVNWTNGPESMRIM